jgi:hypothetical protein
MNISNINTTLWNNITISLYFFIFPAFHIVSTLFLIISLYRTVLLHQRWRILVSNQFLLTTQTTQDNVLIPILLWSVLDFNHIFHHVHTISTFILFQLDLMKKCWISIEKRRMLVFGPFSSSSQHKYHWTKQFHKKHSSYPSAEWFLVILPKWSDNPRFVCGIVHPAHKPSHMGADLNRRIAHTYIQECRREPKTPLFPTQNWWKVLVGSSHACSHFLNTQLFYHIDYIYLFSSTY